MSIRCINSFINLCVSVCVLLSNTSIAPLTWSHNPSFRSRAALCDNRTKFEITLLRGAAQSMPCPLRIIPASKSPALHKISDYEKNETARLRYGLTSTAKSHIQLRGADTFSITDPVLLELLVGENSLPHPRIGG